MACLHLLTGLAADRTAFDRLGIFTSLPIHHLDWLPNYPKESLTNYAKRLIATYQIEQEDYLLGLSFGGLVSLEIARILGNPKVILLSSFRDKKDLRAPLRWAIRLGLHRLIPTFRLQLINDLIKYQFSVTSKEGGNVLDLMLDHSDLKLTKWSVQKIAESEFSVLPKTEIHSLIGDTDKMVKTWAFEQQVIIPGGGHFMVFEQADIITDHLKKILV